MNEIDPHFETQLERDLYESLSECVLYVEMVAKQLSHTNETGPSKTAERARNALGMANRSSFRGI